MSGMVFERQQKLTYSAWIAYSLTQLTSDRLNIEFLSSDPDSGDYFHIGLCYCQYYPPSKTNLWTSQRFGGLMVKNPPANAGYTCSIPGLGWFYMQQGN